MPNEWTPLLTGRDAERATARISAIADALRSDIPTDASLSWGSAGEALLFAYLGDAERAELLLEAALGEAASGTLSSALFSGFPGVGFVFAHLTGEMEDDPLGPVDKTVLDDARDDAMPREYDLIGGIVGLGVYALERLPRADAVETLRTVVRHLEARAERPAAGQVTWFTPPALVPENQRTSAPDGYYNLGVAHGIPGVIGFLGEVVATNLVPEAAPLVDAAVAWLLAQQLPAASRSSFPYSVLPGRMPQPARSGWCYGDPGVAAALLVAARGAQRSAWERAAIDILRLASERALEETGIQDAALCHGAAGLGHLFNRAYQATGDNHLADGARTWFRRALDMPLQRRAFLTGTTGLALGLLAATTDQEPAWDRLLLAAVPR